MTIFLSEMRLNSISGIKHEKSNFSLSQTVAHVNSNLQFSIETLIVAMLNVKLMKRQFILFFVLGVSWKIEIKWKMPHGTVSFFHYILSPLMQFTSISN